MTIILTNDDGIDAPGIRALQQAVSEPTTIVAPDRQYSGCGHQVTTHRGMKLEKRSPTEYALSGTPADCTRMAINKIATDTKLVLSGINAGGNLGTDVYISGTVAAVREAAIHGIPAIAFSHWIKRPSSSRLVCSHALDKNGVKRSVISSDSDRQLLER